MSNLLCLKQGMVATIGNAQQKLYVRYLKMLRITRQELPRQTEEPSFRPQISRKAQLLQRCSACGSCRKNAKRGYQSAVSLLSQPPAWPSILIFTRHRQSSSVVIAIIAQVTVTSRSGCAGAKPRHGTWSRAIEMHTSILMFLHGTDSVLHEKAPEPKNKHKMRAMQRRRLCSTLLLQRLYGNVFQQSIPRQRLPVRPPSAKPQRMLAQELEKIEGRLECIR